jgi:hypothetical protein
MLWLKTHIKTKASISKNLKRLFNQASWDSEQVIKWLYRYHTEGHEKEPAARRRDNLLIAEILQQKDFKPAVKFNARSRDTLAAYVIGDAINELNAGHLPGPKFKNNAYNFLTLPSHAHWNASEATLKLIGVVRQKIDYNDIPSLEKN